jgi:hypothetical protein
VSGAGLADAAATSSYSCDGVRGEERYELGPAWQTICPTSGADQANVDRVALATAIVQWQTDGAAKWFDVRWELGESRVRDAWAFLPELVRAVVRLDTGFVLLVSQVLVRAGERLPPLRLMARTESPTTVLVREARYRVQLGQPANVGGAKDLFRSLFAGAWPGAGQAGDGAL